MTVSIVTSVQKYIGESGDVKPATPPVGSTFFETDTGSRYIFDGVNWILEK